MQRNPAPSLGDGRKGSLDIEEALQTSPEVDMVRDLPLCLPTSFSSLPHPHPGQMLTENSFFFNVSLALGLKQYISH